MDSCVLQNVTHINRYRRSEGVKEPFNVSLTNSRWIDCSNGFYGSIVRDVEDQTTFRAVNNTFLRGVTNGETTGAAFTKTTVVVSTDHSYVSCTFTSCVAFNTSGGAIRCRDGVNLNVTKCTFRLNKCEATEHDTSRKLAVGGAVHFNGDSTGRLQITTSLFEHNLANLGAAVSSQSAGAFLFQLSNITNGTCIRYDNNGYSFGGGLMVEYLPAGAIVTNLRFDACNTQGSGGSIDCSNMTGSITFSNIFVANSKAPRGNVIFSNALNISSSFKFFSCTFFNNTSTQKDSKGKSHANDVRLNKEEPWTTLLKSQSSFVNCFSTSNSPKIAFMNEPIEYTFGYVSSTNTTELGIHLPAPAVIVNEQEGKDVNGCGTDYSNKCGTIAFTGTNRVALTGGKVLIEAGHYEETGSFDLGSKPVTFTSFGDISPIINYSGESTAFITKGIGTVRFVYLSFVPSKSSHVILQNANGGLEIADCSFVASDDASVEMQKSAVKATDGKVSLNGVSFVGLRLNGGSCVECVGSTTEVTISQSEFVSIEGKARSMIIFSRTSAGSGSVTMDGTRVVVKNEHKVGGIQISNVKTVSMTGMQFANVNSDEQEAAIDIASCTSLTLSSLLFERCIGKSASDIFVTNSPSVSLSSPLSQSFSASRSPTSSINGVASDNWLTRTPLAVDGTSGSDEEFCWKNVGCPSITSLLSHVDHSVKWNTTLKEETVGDSAISIWNNLQLTMTGTTQAGSILSHTGLVSSPLLSVASGSLSVSQLTLLTNKAGTTRTSSFFVMTGGSLSFTSVTFPSLSFSNSGSMLQVSGTGSLSVTSVDFSSDSTDGVGSVLHSTSSGKISLNTVSLSGNKCGSGKKGRSIAIESTTPFVSSSVVMTNVQITSEGSAGDHEVFLKGPSLPLTVTSSNFGSTLGSQADQTVAKMKQFFGEDTSDASMSGPLSYLLYRHSTGPVSVDASFWDHGFCGLSALPCKSLEMAHSKVNETDQIVDFVSDVKMTGTIVSKSSGSIIKSSSGKKMTADSTSQFVIGTGKMRLESLTLELPSVLSQALFVVSGGTLDVKSTVTLTNPTTTSHTSSLMSMSGGTVVLDGSKLTTTQKLTLASSALMTQSKGSLTISNMKIENVSRTTGDGSVISATLAANTDELSIISTSFTLCSCSGGNGGALFVSLSGSALFSITGTSSFTSCTASGKGSKLYLSRSDLVSFMSTGNLNSIKPALSTKAAADSILNEFYGFESLSSEGSLLFYWYPFSTLDSTMHVHSSGHAHSLCGKEALPCKTLPDSLNKIQSATTLMIDTNIDLPSKIVSPNRAWTLTKSGSAALSFITSGQLEISNSQSALTLSSLSLNIGTLTSGRTVELITVSAGSLVVSSCTVFASTPSLSVSFVSLSNGKASFPDSTMNIPTLTSKPFVSVSGGTLDVNSSTSLVNSNTATHKASLVSIDGGTFLLDEAALTTSKSMNFASSSLIVQTKGSLTMSSMNIENVSRTTGDGSVISATLSANTDKLSILSTTFTSCSCSGGNGGVLFVSLSSSALFSITGTSSFTSCTASGKGSKLYLSRPDLVSFMSTGNLDSIKPTLSTKAAADGILNEFYGFESLSSEGSLLFYWYPFSTLDSTMHVHSSGHAHSLCGKEALPCKTLSDSLSNIQSATTLMIDTNIELPSKLTSIPRALTLTKSGSAALTIITSGQLEISNSQSTLTLSSLSLNVGTLTSGRTVELITISAGSLVVSSCTVFASTPSLSVSFVSLSNGKASFPDSTMNIPTLTSKPFVSVSGGTLDVDSSTSLVNSNTAAHQASLLSMNGGTVALDGTKLTTTQKLTLASSALMTQSKGSLTISNVKFENISRTTGDGSVISATLAANTDELSIVSTTFTSCSCSSGNGGALFVSLSTSAFFSITGSSSFTSCTASGKGSKLYLSQPSLVSFLTLNDGTGPLNVVRPTLTTKAIADGILNEFYGFESSSSEGSLLFYWYPFSTLDSTMHVHSSGHAHPLCGKEALPCQTLPDSLNKIQSASTLMIDTNIELPSKIVSPNRALTLTKSGSSALTIITSGQLEISNSQSALTLSSLSLNIGTLTSGRTVELITVSAGFLVLSSCTIFSSTSNLPVSFVTLSGGVVSMTTTTLHIPTIQSKPVISVTGGELQTDSSTSLVNSGTAIHQASPLSVGGGTVVLDGASLTTSKSMTFASSSLIVQTKGSLTMSSMNIENVSRTTGDGSVISATLATGTDKLSIVSTAFASCSSAAGNGGALFVSLSASALFSITGTSSFTSCTASGKGSKLYLSRPNLISFLTPYEGTGPLDSIKPTLSTKAAADSILNEFYGFESSSSEGSLLFYWYPFSTDDTTMHVHSSGHAHSLCGKEALPCQTLTDSLSKIQSATTLMIDTNIELPSKLTSIPRALTLTKSGSAALTIITSGQLEISNSQSTLTLSSHSLNVGTLTSGRTVELITISAGSLVVSSCTVFASTPSLSVSFVSLSNGKVSFPDSTMNIPTLTSKPFVSVSGGTLDVKSTVTLTNPTTTSHSSSLMSMSGGTVALDGTKLTTTQKLTLASSALMTQSKGSLTISNVKFENISRTTGDGSVISATLAANTDELSIISTTFKLCSCSAGNGGALFVDLSASASTSILFSSLTFGSGSDSNTAILGTNVFVKSSDLNRDCAGVLIGLKPTLSGSLLTTAEKNEYFGIQTSPESLLFFWYPHVASSGAVHVHSSGEDHVNCGLFELACKTLSHSFTSLKTTRTITLDSSLSLPSSLPALTNSLTLNSVVPGSPRTLSAGSGVCFTVSSAGF
ncbi:hypothetical protein BLNAU_17683 [Blattamonas nauphoetae]|uniref:Uncharacterized protein n=1 Tax=Blattamonas nauphoetae TaxID=2049346 RepID=A0ABQ9X6F5_9EUKA|nr:hypothetical protein BLNAU_17683 [Blattamonas nauphoetae]